MSMLVQNITSERVPFRLAGNRNPLILVPVYVNDMGPYEFILDTGGSHCLISPERSVTLGIRSEMEEEAMGAGGSFKLGLGHVTSLAVGATRRHNVPVAITNELGKIAATIKSPVDGD